VNVHAAPRRSGSQILAAWGGVALLAIVWVYLGFGNASAIREIVAVPLVLVTPGGLLVMMLPNRTRPKDPIFRLALAVGLSIAFSIIVGLLLDVLPSGIDRRTWACALGLVSVTEAVAVASRGVRVGEIRSSWLSGILRRTDAKAAIVAVVATLVVLGAVITIVASERSNAEMAYHQERFAELWVESAPSGTPVIGVRSDTSGRDRFRLLVSASGQSIESYTFTLKWQQTWTRKVSIAPGTEVRVLISLFSGSSKQPSERVWYNTSSGA
jgi:hypothetical protein